MNKFAIHPVYLAGLAVLLAACTEEPKTEPQSMAEQPTAIVVEPDPERVLLGREVAEDRGRGNCLACHQIADGEFAGNIGPPLIMMRVRYPDRTVLLEQISDPTVRNPSTVMPPYGKHRILTENELQALTDYIWTL